MERRTFLRTLFAGATGAAVAAVLPDPERLLWIPGERSHFLPPAGGWRVDGRGLSASSWQADYTGQYWTPFPLPQEQLQLRYPDGASLDAIAHDARPQVYYDVITRDALRVLDAQLHAAKTINREYDVRGVRPGEVIRINVPRPRIQFVNPRQVGVIDGL